MNTVADIIRIVFGGLEKLSEKNLYLTVIGALVFSALMGVFCSFLYKLWNKSYKTTLTHKTMTAFSAVFSFIFIIAFAGFTFFEEVAKLEISSWEEGLKSDASFTNSSFVKAYYNVLKLGIEDFTKYPKPENEGNTIPAAQPESQLEIGKTYYEAAIENFKDKHSFLAIVLSVKSENTPDSIRKDIEQDFAKGTTYYLMNGTKIAANNLKNALLKQAPKVVKASRTILVMLFILIQLIPLGAISYSAYKDLKIHPCHGS